MIFAGDSALRGLDLIPFLNPWSKGTLVQNFTFMKFFRSIVLWKYSVSYRFNRMFFSIPTNLAVIGCPCLLLIWAHPGDAPERVHDCLSNSESAPCYQGSCHSESVRSGAYKAPVHRPGYRDHDHGVSGGIDFGNCLEQGDE